MTVSAIAALIIKIYYVTMIQKLIIFASLTLLSPIQSSMAQAASPIKDGRLECPVIRPIAQGFLSNHVDAKALDLEHEGRTIEQFIKRLDPSKIYLYQSDVAEIRGLLRGIFNKLGTDCSGIDKAHAILVKRMTESYEFAQKYLGDNFKFLENTELVFNADQRQFPKDKTEAEAQMAKFLQFQISNYLASDMKLPQAKKQLIHRYLINSKRQDELKRDELYSMFLDSFANGLDAHSSYLSQDSLEDFEIQMRLSLEGIGAALTWEDGYTTVESLIPGGAAEASGELKPKDKIISVAQGSGQFEQVIDMPLRDVVKLIRGKKGTQVRLTVMRESAKNTQRLIISLKRDKISLKDEEAKIRYAKRKVNGRDLKIGVIELPSFYGDMQRRTRTCSDDVKKLVQQAVKEKVDGIVFDLSKNGGGLLTEAVKIGGLFIKSGNIVATQNAHDKKDELADEDDGIAYTGPLVLLTSRLSASASEIVAGALQDYKRAVIVGSDHTFGKGTVQAMINLPSELGAIKVTTGMFFVPGGESTQYRGVPGDVVIPSLFSTKDIGERSLDYSLQPRALPAFLSKEANVPEGPANKDHWTPVDDSLVKKLRTLSSARVEKDPEFAKIKKELAEQEQKKGVIKLSDSLKKQREDKKDPKKQTAGRRNKRQTDEDYLKAPDVNEAISVMGDMIVATSSQQQAKN